MTWLIGAACFLAGYGTCLYSIRCLNQIRRERRRDLLHVLREPEIIDFAAYAESRGRRGA